MPKRTRDKQDDFDYLTKKLRKLERKIERRRRRHSDKSDTSSSEADRLTPRNRQVSDKGISFGDVAPENGEDSLPGCSYWTDDARYNVLEPDEYSDDAAYALPDPVVNPPGSTDIPQPPTTAAAADTQPLLSATPEQCTAPQSAVMQINELDHSTVVQEQVSELDSDLLKILGEDPTTAKEYGKDIQKDLAIRLSHIATSGLSKEIRKELKEKYLVPSNCKLIKAPTLNPEIRAALVESQAKRDKGIENKQALTACALSSLSEAITLILASNNKNPELLKLLMDSARMLSDIQHSDSISRRFFILSTVKKELKDQLEKTKIDETLFGNNLPETLKSAKIINKSGAELRSALTVKSDAQKTGKAPARPLNYRAPPAGRRPAPTGGARGARTSNPTPRPTSTSTQHNASRTSSRQRAPRHRR